MLPAFGAEPPLERTTIDAFKIVKTAPEVGKLPPADEVVNIKAFVALDFKTFGADCLGPSANKLSPLRPSDGIRRQLTVSAGSGARTMSGP